MEDGGILGGEGCIDGITQNADNVDKQAYGGLYEHFEHGATALTRLLGRLYPTARKADVLRMRDLVWINKN